MIDRNGHPRYCTVFKVEKEGGIKETIILLHRLLRKMVEMEKALR